ncbi:unnamed protein product, partial [Pylaiella littoralis]
NKHPHSSSSSTTTSLLLLLLLLLLYRGRSACYFLVVARQQRGPSSRGGSSRERVIAFHLQARVHCCCAGREREEAKKEVNIWQQLACSGWRSHGQP